MTTGPAPICVMCTHWWGQPPKGEKWGFGCDAFPDGKGIPDSISMAGPSGKHDQPLPEQGNNIVFERK